MQQMTTNILQYYIYLSSFLIVFLQQLRTFLPSHTQQHACCPKEKHVQLKHPAKVLLRRFSWHPGYSSSKNERLLAKYLHIERALFGRNSLHLETIFEAAANSYE